jgi:allantoin racemase
MHPATPVELLLLEVAYVQAAMDAERDGFDAAILNTFMDYGLRRIRSAVRMPVIGAGEAAMTVAGLLGRRFSIVTVWPRSTGPIYDDMLREYGIGDRCTGVRHVTDEAEMEHIGDEDGFFQQLQGRKDAMLDRIVEEIRLAVDQDGADTVVLGCTCMCIAHDDLSQRVDIPLVDPLDAAYVMARSLVQLGLSHSTTRFVPTTTDHSALLAGTTAVLDQHLGDTPQDCPVCAWGDMEPEDEVAAPQPAA